MAFKDMVTEKKVLLNKLNYLYIARANINNVALMECETAAYTDFDTTAIVNSIDAERAAIKDMLISLDIEVYENETEENIQKYVLLG